MYTHEQIVLITQAPPSQFFLIITTEKYPWNCIFMAHVQYQEADPAPSKVKVCISSCWIKGLKRYFILGMSAFLQFSGFPKLNWNGLELNTLKKATKSLQIKRVQGLVAWHGKPKSLKLIWWKSGANKRDLLPNLEYLWRDFQGELLQHRKKNPTKSQTASPKSISNHHKTKEFGAQSSQRFSHPRLLSIAAFYGVRKRVSNTKTVINCSRALQGQNYGAIIHTSPRSHELRRPLPSRLTPH